MNLDEYIKHILSLCLLYSSSRTLIVTNTLDESKLVIERILSIHKELPDWLWLKIDNRTTNKETMFSNNSSIMVLTSNELRKGLSFDQLGYFDKFNRNNPPEVITHLGRDFVTLTYKS